MGMGAITFMLCAFTVVLLTVGLTAWPYWTYIKSGTVAWEYVFASGVLVVIINFIAVYLPMRTGLNNLRSMSPSLNV